MRLTKVVPGVLLAAVLGLPGCGDDEKKPASGVCSVSDRTGCDPGMVCLDGADGEVGCFCSTTRQTGCENGDACEEVVGGDPTCFARIVVSGQVVSTVDGGPVEGATVVAQDANGVAVSGVAVTDENGEYELAVSVPRDEDGNPADETLYTLRADALGYQTFPEPPRVALPVDMTDASGDPPVVESAATTVALIPLPASPEDLGTVSGTVDAEEPSGTLVVVGGQTAIADRDGNFTVFNVPAGSAEVRGYLAGTQLSSTTVDVTAGEVVDEVTLEATGEATATVSGSVQIVNAPGGSLTTVILVVEDTFVENAAKGEAPPGLRATDVSGEWQIENVPDGEYVALAAFENDHLVRDPDTSIGGTEIVHLTVQGGSVTPDPLGGFKVTEALDVIQPGAEGAEAVTSATPTFVFEDDSSEAGYTVVVYDAFGELIWQTEGDFDPGGNADVEVTYAGPALEPGMYYQFRATSYDGDLVPLSSTEDLRGVFWYDG